jgi:hypothetical protein
MADKDDAQTRLGIEGKVEPGRTDTPICHRLATSPASSHRGGDDVVATGARPSNLTSFRASQAHSQLGILQ